MDKKIIFYGILVIILIIIGIFFILNSKCDYDDPSKTYHGKNIASGPKSMPSCAVIKFVCLPNTRYFSDKCGCGCEIIEKGD